MQKYKKILVGVELDPKSDAQILTKAEELKQQFNAQIYFIHCVEHLSNYGAAYGVSAGIDIEEILVQEAQKSIQDLGKKFQVPANQILVKMGTASHVIVDEAKTLGIQLIVIGSHGRHGVRLLLGSTANGVLHSAHCDVLAVRLKTE